ncbi:hypothetical protein EHS25_001790 [Saitozyma podzolica]|uniref:Uncharacterized protein n=1 Tax=Saitozyma podzolica TaxID=1890683 RepID=A0A427YFV6_9TREE|nr:hypothetical protein EHS25_001790 [Saitozyma podzolica]
MRRYTSRPAETHQETAPKRHLHHFAAIRAAGSPAPSQATDNALITLPAKLGGLGNLSFKTCAPLAYAAASEASDSLLAPLLDQDTDNANQTVLSRRLSWQSGTHSSSPWTRRALNQSRKRLPCLEESGSRSYPSLQRSGSAISRYQQPYTHKLCFQGQRLIAGTVEPQTSWDTTGYASGEPPGRRDGMNKPNAPLEPP